MDLIAPEFRLRQFTRDQHRAAVRIYLLSVAQRLFTGENKDLLQHLDDVIVGMIVVIQKDHAIERTLDFLPGYLSARLRDGLGHSRFGWRAAAVRASILSMPFYPQLPVLRDAASRSGEKRSGEKAASQTRPRQERHCILRVPSVVADGRCARRTNATGPRGTPPFRKAEVWTTRAKSLQAVRHCKLARLLKPGCPPIRGSKNSGRTARPQFIQCLNDSAYRPARIVPMEQKNVNGRNIERYYGGFCVGDCSHLP